MKAIDDASTTISDEEFAKLTEVDDFDGIVSLAHVKSYYKVVSGKLIYVHEYENKVTKKEVADLHHDTEDAVKYEIPGHGEISVPPEVKVYKTQFKHHIVTGLGKSTFTMKNNGEVVPTQTVMKNKIKAGKLAQLGPKHTSPTANSVLMISLQKKVLDKAPVGSFYTNEHGTWTKTADGDWGNNGPLWMAKYAFDHNLGLHPPGIVPADAVSAQTTLDVVDNLPIGTVYVSGNHTELDPSITWHKVSKNKWAPFGSSGHQVSDQGHDNTVIASWVDSGLLVLAPAAPEVAESLPVGTKLVGPADAVWIKDADDNWHNLINGEWGANHSNNWVNDNVLISSAWKVGPTESHQDAAVLPVGTKIVDPSQGLGVSWLKTANNNWHGVNEALGQDIGDQDDHWINTYLFVKGNSWKVVGPATDSPKLKEMPLGSTIENPANGAFYTKTTNGWQYTSSHGEPSAGFETDSALQIWKDDPMNGVGGGDWVLKSPLADWEQELLGSPAKPPNSEVLTSIKALPIGSSYDTGLEVTWIKTAANKWQAYNKSGNLLKGVLSHLDIAMAGLVVSHWPTYKLTLGVESNAAGYATLEPHNAAGYAVVGTKVVNDKGQTWEKTSPNIWSYFDEDGNKPGSVHSSSWINDSLSKNASWKTYDTIVPSLKATTLPIGTTFASDKALGVWTKTAPNEWSWAGPPLNAKSPNNDVWAQGWLIDNAYGVGADWHVVPKPNSGEPTPAKSLPIGSTFTKGDLGGVWKKTAEDKWEWYIKPTDTVSGNVHDDHWVDEWLTKDNAWKLGLTYKAADLPVGTKVVKPYTSKPILPSALVAPAKSVATQALADDLQALSNLPPAYNVPGHGFVVLEPGARLYGPSGSGNYLMRSKSDNWTLLKTSGYTSNSPNWSLISLAKQGKINLLAYGDPNAKEYDGKVADGLSAQFFISKTKNFLKSKLTIDSAEFALATKAQRASLLGSDEVYNALKSAIDTLTPVSKWKEAQIDKPTKTVVAKNRSRFAILLRASELARKVDANEATPEFVQEELAFLSSKMAYPNVGKTFGAHPAPPFDIEAMYGNLQTKAQVYAYKKSLVALGFDPVTATTDQLMTYAKSQGFTNAAALTAPELLTWVKVKLGDPEAGYPVSTLAILQDKASFTIAKAQIVEQAQVTISQGTAKSMAKISSPVAIAQDASDYQAKLKLVSKYIGAPGEHPDFIVYEGGESYGPWTHYEWTEDIQAYEPIAAYNDVNMLEIVQAASHVWKPDPDAGPVYGPKAVDVTEKMKAFETAFGKPNDMSPTQLNAYIKSHGGNYVGYMDAATKKTWIKFDILGDEVGKYSIEETAAQHAKGSGAHKWANTHPGSHESPAGKKAIQAQVDILATTPWGQHVLTALHGSSPHIWSSSDLQSAYTALGLKVFAPWFMPNDTSIPSDEAMMKALVVWRDQHKTQVEPTYGISVGEFTPSLDLSSASLPTLTKPSEVSQEDWDFVNAVNTLGTDPLLLKDFSTDYGTLSELEVDTKLKNSYAVSQGSYGIFYPYVQNAPINIKRLVLYAATKNTAESKSIAFALGSMASQGAWLDKTKGQLNFILNANTEKTVALKPGDKVYSVSKGSPSAGFLPNHAIVSVSGAVKEFDGSGYPYASDAPASWYETNATLVASGPPAPKAMTFEEAQKQIPELLDWVWTAVDNYEKESPDTISLPLSEASDEGLTSYILTQQHDWKLNGQPELSKDELASMPLVSKMVLAYGIDYDHDLAQVVAFKAHSGHYAVAAKMIAPPNAPYAQLVAQGKTDYYKVNNYWSNATKVAYAVDNHLDIGNNPSSILAATIISDHLQDKLKAAIEPPPVMTSHEWILTKNPHPIGLDGMHTKQEWFNQHGQDVMTKSFVNDPNGPGRVDCETNAMKIGKLFGYNNPETRSMTVKGVYSYAQILVPAKGNAEPLLPTNMSNDLLAQAMQVHVLDWIISNHDTHPSNLLVTPDGKKIIPIDEGQAFRFFPDDQLAVGYLPFGNGVPVWYDRFYKALMSGEISKETADYVTSQVLLKAWKVQTQNDTKYRQYLEAALEKRWNWPTQYPTRELFIEALMQRKHTAYNDFVQLYKGVYAKSPYSYDVDITELLKAKINDEINVSLTQDLVDEVTTKAKVKGKALMFNSTDLEDGTLLLYTEKAYNGSTTFKGEAKIRDDADKVLTNWLKAQDVKVDAGNHDSDSYEAAPPSLDLPNNAKWFSAILQCAKTVNAHAADGGYNATTVEQLESTQTSMSLQLAQVEGWMAGNASNHGELPTSVPGIGTFQNQGQLDAWYTMISTYQTMIAEILNAKSLQQKTPNKAYQQFAYVAAPAAPKVIAEYTSGSETYTLQKLADNTWQTVSNVDGTINKKDVDTAEFLIKKDNLLPSTTTETQIGTKVLKVTKRQASSTVGHYDSKTEELVHSHKDSAGNTEGNLGYQYDIEYPGVKIEYRPWAEATTLVSQKGLLRFSIFNHEGGIAEVEDVLSTLRSMGLDLSTPADEKSLELQYWRTFSGHVSSFADAEPGAKYDSIKTGYQSIVQQRKAGVLEPDAELAALQALWVPIIGQPRVDAVFDEKKYLPYFGHYVLHDPTLTTGRPVWDRPDVTLADLHKIYGNTVVKHDVHEPNNMANIVASGGMYSSEERLRLFGEIINGSSSYGHGNDQQYGGANYVFTRQKRDIMQTLGDPYTGYAVYFTPRVSLRMNSFSFEDDKWGKLHLKATESFWDPETMLGYGMSGNELNIKNGISFLDDVVGMNVPNEDVRMATLKVFKDAGITQLHGVPIEDVVTVDKSKVGGAINHVWQDVLKVGAK